MRPAPRDQFAHPGRVSGHCVGDHVCRRKAGTRADGGILVFGVDQVFDLLGQHKSAVEIKIPDATTRADAEEGDMRNFVDQFRGQMPVQRGLAHGLADRAAVGAVRVIGFVGFSNEGFVHNGS